MKQVRVTDLKAMKQRHEKIAVLTAYDAAMATFMDRAGLDVILVGDSLGMVVLGYDTTVPVTMEDMIHHTKAVTRVVNRALVVADMPFLSYHISLPEAVRNAGRLFQEAGAAAVKIEGGQPVLELTRRLVEIGMPVMGHLGLTPQSVHQLGGFRMQAKSDRAAARLVEDARCLEEAGAFSIVLESIPEQVAATVTEALTIPTIGIGAGPYCDGQVLVSHDAFDLSTFAPSFVKQFARLGQTIHNATEEYIREVKSGAFPESKARAKEGVEPK